MSMKYSSASGQGLLSLFAKSLREPEYWAYSSWLELSTKYRQTTLGLLWMSLPLLVFVLILGNVYSHLMGYAPSVYLPYLAVGYVLWRFILQVVNESVGAFTTHRQLVMEGSVRLTDFVLSVLAKATFGLLFGGIVIVGIFIWSPVIDVRVAWTLIFGIPLLFLNMGWVAVCGALIGARFRDFREVIGTILVIGLLVTPILWPVDRFPADSTRGLLVRLNPAFHLIDVVRSPLLGTPAEASSYWVVAIMAVLGWLFACWVYKRCARFVPLWV